MSIPALKEPWLRFVVVFLVALALGSSASRAQSPFVFQLPLERITHAFTLYYAGGDADAGSTTYDMVPHLGWDGAGNYILDATSHIEIDFGVDPSALGQYWLLDCTTGEFSLLNSADLRTSYWVVGQPSDGNQTSSPTLWFALGMDRAQHALTLAAGDGSVLPITQTAASGGVLNAQAFPTSSLQASGIHFNVIDLTTGEQAPDSATNVTVAAWTPTGQGGFVHSATILVTDTSSNYTFHTSSGAMQELSAFWNWASDPVTGLSGSGYMVSGAVGAGETFWVTRDSDGASSPHQQMLFSPQYVDWSGSFPPPPVRNIQSLSFQIGQSRDGHTLSVHEPDGYVAYLYVAPWNWYDSNWMTSYDQNGNAFDYYYTNFLADVDMNQSWWLVDETTGENLGTTQSVMDGYNPYRPPPPAPNSISINVANSRHGHTLVLQQDDGNTSAIAPASGYESQDAYLSEWNYSSYTDQYVEVRYFPAVGATDPGQGFFINDQNTGESQHCTAGTTSVDLSGWLSPPASLGVNLSVTRWTHQLTLCQPDGESFPVVNGSVQGNWNADPQNQSGFTTYGFYNATTSFHSEMDWWIYDATSGETSPVNQTDLTQWKSWMDAEDTDGDGLPNWYEYLIGTNPYAFSTVGDGISDGWKVQHGLNPLDANAANAVDPASGGLTYRQVYQGFTALRLEVDIGRFTHGFTFHYTDLSGNSASSLPFSAALDPVMHFDGKGRLA